MELKLSSIQLRIFTKIKEMNAINFFPSKKDISEELKEFHTETCTQEEINYLKEIGILEETEDRLYINEIFKDLNWLKYLTSYQKYIIVLGMPGNHTIEFVKELDKRNVLYIDHDVAWKFLMDNSSKNISIISPFADKLGFKIFGPSLINACKRKVHVEIITRDISPFSKESHRRKAFTNFLRTITDEIRDPDLSIFQIHDGVNDEEFAIHLGSVHAKALMQDTSAVYIGSGEFRGNSISKNIEIGYIFTDENTILSIKNIYDSTKAIALKVNWKELL